MKIIKGIVLFCVVTIVSVNLMSSSKTVQNNVFVASENLKVAYFASGCFWCVEAVFESVQGVEEAVSGYAGGFTENPNYTEIGKGTTGHAETVAVYYDPKLVSYETLVTVFFGSHDPTTKNGQHPDYGSQYRSIVFYQNENELKIINKIIATLNKELYNGKIVTEVTNFTKFYEAEAYHQNFEKRNPNQPYVKAVSIPRLNRFKKKFPDLLKNKEH